MRRTRRNTEGPAAVGVRGSQTQPAGMCCFPFHTFCCAATPRFVWRLGEERKNNKENEKKQQKGGAEKSAEPGIEQEAAFHHQNSNKQLLTNGCGNENKRKKRKRTSKKKRRRRKKSPELCRFVSEGEKSAARSNGPLIFPSCIKGSALWGGRAGEAALLTFAVYLTPRFRWRIHTYAAAAASVSAVTRVFFIANFHRNYSVLFSLTRPSSLSETLKNDKRRSDTLPYSPLVLPQPQPD